MNRPNTFLRLVVLAGIFLQLAAPVRAVYAPVPEQEQGKNLVITVKSGVSFDTNLFGASSKNVETAVFQFSPKAAYAGSLTDQTFVAAGYQLTVDHFDNRPGEKTLNSHEMSARVAHAFTPKTTLDVLDIFQSSRNPESLLNGLPLNSDQSNSRNEVNVTFSTAPTAKTGVTVKGRTVSFNYRSAALGRNLDRTENNYGVAGSYGVLPEVKAVAEYRHQDVFYAKLGETKNKQSDYLMAGLDYAFAKKFTASARAGAEWRDRSAERSGNSPYAELSVKYDYSQSSFLSAGYMLTLEETSDTARFTDSKINRFFINVQHHVTALIVVSGSLTHEFSVLQGRRGQLNLDEQTMRAGAALSYLPTKNWTVFATYDIDRLKSDERDREMLRHRVGLTASYSF